MIPRFAISTITGLAIAFSVFLTVPSASQAQVPACGPSFDAYSAGVAAAEACGLHIHPLTQTMALPGGG